LNTTDSYNAFFDFSLMGALLLPLASFVLAHLISSRYGWLVSVLSPLISLISLILSIVVFVSAWGGPGYQHTWPWFSVGGQMVDIGFNIDNQVALMILIVSLVSFLVHVYSTGYMAGDSGIARYFGMLGFFTFSMLGLVVASNLLVIFIFWELVGFSSYMLIGHWRERPQAATAARRAFVINRVGDAGFLVGLMVLWAFQGSLNISALQQSESFSWQTFAALSLFCGIIGKSAQFPLQTWLPDAMEGPTPISALIHAATMVAAGVFLLARVNFLFTATALDVVVVVGAITALMGSISALMQTDLKKILAYSTISQLGFMMIAHGVGSSAAAMLHLFSHAFFKACLFLSAGAIIHSVHQAQYHGQVHVDLQDIRNLGGLRKKMPFTFIMFLISGGALAGLPLFSGFLSKDAILEGIFTWKGTGFSWRWLILLSAFAVSLLTVLYTFRLINGAFGGEERATRSLALEEPPIVMRVSMLLLAMGSGWFVLSANPFDYSGWVYQQLHAGKDFHIGWMPIISAVWVLFAFAVAYALFRKRNFTSPFLTQGFYWDKVLNFLIGRPTVQLSAITQNMDKKWIDGFIHFGAHVQVTVAHLTGWFDTFIVDGIANGVAATARTVGSFTRSFQGGKIQLYIFWAILAIIIFLIWILF